MKLFIDYLNKIKGEGEENTFLLNENKINLNSEYSNIHIEKFIGKISENEGGRIDITIEDSENRLICIENKIYAAEQDKQLLRYNNFANKFKEFHLLFLTLHGNKCSTLNEEDGIVYSISYKKHIVEWLELCKKEAVNLPILRETIGQYINLIKKLTNQTTNIKMEKDIQKIIQNNLEEAKLIKENYDNTVLELIHNQVKDLKDCFVHNGFSENEVSIAKFNKDSLYVLLKSFNKDEIELRICIELRNNYFFFVVAPINGDRNCRDNDSENYNTIKHFLHSKINNLTLVNSWTIGKADDFTIGIDKERFYFPDSYNIEIFQKFVERILEFKKILSDN